MNWTWRHILFLVVVVAGFFTLLWSASDWYELVHGARMDASFCSINEYWNCDRATLSSAGSFHSIPIGIFGALWFWIAAILTLLVRHSIYKRIWYALGLAAIAGFGGYLLIVLKTGCIVCIFSYLLIASSVFLGWKLRPLDLNHKTWGRALSLLAVGIFFLGIYSLVKNNELSSKMPESEFHKWYDSFSVERVNPMSPLTKGKETAPIVVVEFSDFGCPFCQKVSEILMPYLLLQDDVRVVFFPFPLDSECNPSVKQSVHPRACLWSRVAICLNEQNQFWNFHDKIFRLASKEERLPSLEEGLQEMDLKMDRNLLNSCLSKPESEQKLRELIQYGLSLNVESTPTFWVNGRKLDGFIRLPLLKRLIEELRKKVSESSHP